MFKVLKETNIKSCSFKILHWATTSFNNKSKVNASSSKQKMRTFISILCIKKHYRKFSGKGNEISEYLDQYTNFKICDNMKDSFSEKCLFVNTALKGFWDDHKCFRDLNGVPDSQFWSGPNLRIHEVKQEMEASLCPSTHSVRLPFK